MPILSSAYDFFELSKCLNSADWDKKGVRVVEGWYFGKFVIQCDYIIDVVGCQGGKGGGARREEGDGGMGTRIRANLGEFGGCRRVTVVGGRVWVRDGR